MNVAPVSGHGLDIRISLGMLWETEKSQLSEEGHIQRYFNGRRSAGCRVR